jgi:hypothetical protein
MFVPCVTDVDEAARVVVVAVEEDVTAIAVALEVLEP